ncbi:hypothetical protein BIU92_13985 [Curtobacterium sp. MCBA15_003]|nr:hypothetical protein BIU92_13985 [Curtobacterium sp. MCBA15_003]OII32565.1 hypothetical protein BIU94_04490 [Curtobacterium sp. MMLR14_006]
MGDDILAEVIAYADETSILFEQIDEFRHNGLVEAKSLYECVGAERLFWQVASAVVLDHFAK